MRNAWRVLAFDVAPPLAAIAALVYIGIALAWPLWWVSVCSVLCLLIVEGCRRQRRAGAPRRGDRRHRRRRAGLRLAVAAAATAALVAAVVVGYLKWTVPDRNLHNDTAEVVGIASSVAEASATFTPQSPTASIDRATSMMSPQSAEAFKNEFAAVAKDLTSRNVVGSGQHRVCGRRGDRPGRGQRRRGPARDTELAGQAARHRGARAAGAAVQAGRPLVGRRRVADPLALAEQAGVVDLQAAIHHDLQAGRRTVAGDLSSSPQTLLQPQRFRADLDRVAQHGRQMLAAAEHVDEVGYRPADPRATGRPRRRRSR